MTKAMKDYRTYSKDSTHNRSISRVITQNKDVLDRFLDGKSPQEIAYDLDLPVGSIEKNIEKVLDSLVEQFSKPSSNQSFIRYAAFQMRLIERLNTAYHQFTQNPDVKGRSAIISCVKAQSDIYDKIFEKGLEHGVIARSEQKDTADTLRKTPAQLKIQLVAHISELTVLLDRVDDDVYLPQKKHPKKIVREVEKNAQGVVFIAQDWRFAKSNQQKKIHTSILTAQIEHSRLLEARDKHRSKDT